MIILGFPIKLVFKNTHRRVSISGGDEILLMFTEPSNNVSENTFIASLNVNEGADYFVSYVLGGGSQHVLQLLSIEALDHHTLLLLLLLIFTHELFLVNRLLAFLLLHLALLLEEVHHQTLSPHLHLDESRLNSSPELVIVASPHFTCLPHLMPNELLDLSFPSRPNRRLVNSLDGQHES